MRKALILGVTSLLVLTACSNKDPGNAKPANTPPATVAAKSPLTLGPDDHAVALGATESEVKAAGWTVTDNTSSGDTEKCPKVATLDMPDGIGALRISTKKGVSYIDGLGDMHTPEGIKSLSPAADFMKAYPDAKPDDDSGTAGTFKVPVPGHPDASYHFEISHDQVVFFHLQFNDNECQ